MTAGGDRLLWSAGAVECWLISCCSGAELRVSRGEEILLRELYPTKSDLYERARDLKTAMAAGRWPAPS